MLPPGHIAAGFLTAKALLHFTHPAISPRQQTQLLWWGTFFGFAPDLDEFYFFWKNRTLLVGGRDSSTDPHRKYLSHAPVLWLICGLLIYFLATAPYVKYIGLLLWLSSWSHFLLDSIEYGIPWLKPFSNRLFALKNREYKVVVTEKKFIRHSMEFLKVYGRRISFYLEIFIIVIALITFLT